MEQQIITQQDIDEAIEGYKKYHEVMKRFFNLMHPNGCSAALYVGLIAEEYVEWSDEGFGTAGDFKESRDCSWVHDMYEIQQGYDTPEGIRLLMNELLSKFYTADGKFEPLYREDGKLLKNTGFKKANFQQFFDKE